MWKGSIAGPSERKSNTTQFPALTTTNAKVHQQNEECDKASVSRQSCSHSSPPFCTLPLCALWSAVMESQHSADLVCDL